MKATTASSALGAGKRRQILAGAREVFAELGFERASVDVIAGRAGVSKATVYHHFADKEALYVACFSEQADELRSGLRASLEGPVGGDVERALRRIGEKLMELLLSPAVVCLHRHTIGEAARFPQVGRTLFERGPAVVYDALAAYLARWSEQGKLEFDDARPAAVQFSLLCQGDLVVRSNLGVLPRPTRAEVKGTVARAVRTFLRAYGAPAAASVSAVGRAAPPRGR